jgi:hypothetical protein
MNGNRERRCLERYHQQLAARGVDFTFDDLLRDYRVAIAMMIFYAGLGCGRRGSRPSYWRPKMDCLLGAFRDHQCESLFA